MRSNGEQTLHVQSWLERNWQVKGGPGQNQGALCRKALCLIRG